MTHAAVKRDHEERAEPAVTAQRLDGVRFDFRVASSAWLTRDRSAKAQMTIDDYLQKLRSRPKELETSRETYALIEEAVRAHPTSAKLWCLRGALIQLGPADSDYELSDALACYQKAIEVEPDCAEGWEDLGHYHDVHLHDQAAARKFWSIAEALKKKEPNQ
jgi:tetratricopeptide (TPR) repeat protein